VTAELNGFSDRLSESRAHTEVSAVLGRQQVLAQGLAETPRKKVGIEGSLSAPLRSEKNRPPPTTASSTECRPAALPHRPEGVIQSITVNNLASPSVDESAVA